MKQILKKIMPLFVLKWLLSVKLKRTLFKDYMYDLRKINTFSLKPSKDNLEGQIIAHYHVIEKGMSFPNLRLGFGQAVLLSLINLLKIYIDNYPVEQQIFSAYSVVGKYIELHKFHQFDISKIEKLYDRLNIEDSKNFESGGTLTVNKNDMFKNNMDFKSFFESRVTVRHFSDKDVDLSLLFDAISIAQKSPSVCNRQTIRVFIVKDKTNIIEHLKYQNGNRGFGHTINKLLIITSDLRYFNIPEERNQSYIEGGIYTMSLLNSLHHLQLGAVTLNWCVNKNKDIEYHKFSKIGFEYNIITMIGVGHVPENFNVPKSIRKTSTQIIHLI
jgi:hypothetical protein